MFFKRRLRDELRWLFLKELLSFVLLWIYVSVIKREFSLFLGLSFLFRTVLSDRWFNFLALTHWRVLLLCTSRSLFNFNQLQFCTWSRNILAFISWICKLRDCGSHRGTTDDHYVPGLCLVFLGLPSLVIDCGPFVSGVDIFKLFPSIIIILVMSVEGLLKTIASI